MLRTETKLRAWGNSIGLTLPKNIVEQEELVVNEIVMVTIEKVKNPLKVVFGKLKFSKSTDELLKEVDKAFESKY